MFQQNTAQEHRQNNSCANPVGTTGEPLLTGSRADTRCATGDASFNKHTVTEGRGAHASGGSTPGQVVQQNTAQKGRQNNSCASPLGLNSTLNGGRVDGRCVSKDLSGSEHTVTRTGGARTEGGSDVLGGVTQQNTAQEGRQNNSCDQPAFESFTVNGGRADRRCGNRDRSYTGHSLVESEGARTTGGSTTGFNVNQQNAAQEGRQNNSCDNRNTGGIDPTGGRVDSACGNGDRSHTKYSVVKGGGAETTGGSSETLSVFQQNSAQEGRNNNSCDNASSGEITLTGGRVGSKCRNGDRSDTEHSVVKGGGAQTTGGSATAAVSQQNSAQEGRQNNNCADTNNLDATITGGRAHARCTTVDDSATLGSAEFGGGAEAAGGTSGASLFQQNIAQEGRQNNDCANLNNLTLTTSGSRTDNQCVAFDRSKSIGSVYQ
ncbi:hypothetical protein [Streptomyces sp. NPDC048639]|uniref:hypothetical protein n=1 Tax=Streptomyces sp. NPDC048639 TaxID=3365581 RepID=UPI003721698A